ncbi:MAG: BatD family protein [Spirochaetales bacterium]|nr:BatD family protein [Spirochaetales bacterium]
MMLRGIGNMQIEKRRITLLSILIVTQIIFGQTLFGQVDLELSISARECYTGDSLTLQAKVNGTDQVEVEELPDPDWGTITYLGGQRRNSQSITIINGKRTNVIEKAFLMSFQITPGKTGEFTVPQISFNADGETLSSTPFTIRAKEPARSDDYAMTIEPGMTEVYPGQEFAVNVRWYYRNNARSISFNLPFLDDFEFLGQVPGKGRLYDLLLNNMTIQATSEEGYSEAFGEKATYLSFTLLLKAKKEGIWNLSDSTSRFEGVTGSETVRDFFGNKSVQDKFATLVITAEGRSVEVLPMPAPPPGFGISAGSTILGPVSIEAALSKTEISVGEPITLTLSFSGASNSDFSIPPLTSQDVLEKGFSIPPERSPGRNEGDDRVFIQTIRAKNSSTTAFPGLTFPVFDTTSGEWDEVQTAPIPITVLATKIADSGDLEVFEDSGPAIRELERNESGMEASYSGSELMKVKRPGNYPWMSPLLFYILLTLPPAAWLFLFLRKKQFFGRKRSGASEFRKFLKRWKGGEGSLTDFEAALAAFMETETDGAGRGIYGHEEALTSTPEALEAYQDLKSMIDRGLYAGKAGKREEGFSEAGERLLKEMLK